MGTCANCGYESRGTATCPLCGGPIDPGTTAPAPGVPAGTRRPAWEDPAVSFPRNLTDTWVRSLVRPSEFFRGVPWDEAAVRPLLYYLLVAIVAASFTLWWDAALSTGTSSPLLAELGIATPDAGLALLNFFIAPFAALIGLAVWGLLLHVPCMLLARSADRRGLRATIRAVCYSAGPGVLAIVPVLGGLVGAVWTLVLTAIALREAHAMTGGAAAAAVILAALMPVLLLLGLVFLALGAGFLAR